MSTNGHSEPSSAGYTASGEPFFTDPSPRPPVDYRSLWKQLYKRLEQLYSESITSCATSKDTNDIFRSQGHATGFGAALNTMNDLLNTARGLGDAEPDDDGADAER